MDREVPPVLKKEAALDSTPLLKSILARTRKINAARMI
jgi:hypothetical protein